MRILVLSNNGHGLYQLRRELFDALINSNHEVYISVPCDQCVKKIENMGCHLIETKISRHGVNPITDFMLYMKYKSILKEIKPDIVFTYTIKPNVYGGLACQACKVPYLANVTGLGVAIQNGGILQKITLMMYKIGLKGAKHVFFQNSENHHFMTESSIVTSPTTILPEILMFPVIFPSIRISPLQSISPLMVVPAPIMFIWSRSDSVSLAILVVR